MINLPETPDIETSSDDYARRFSGEVGAWFLTMQEEATLKMLSKGSPLRILDVGGGHGQMLEGLLRSGHHVTVLGSAAICSERIQKFLKQGSCEFKVGNILALPFPDQAFDVVLSFRLLPHVREWKKLISELTRVARGVVMVDYPTVMSVNAISPLLFKFKKKWEGNTRTFTCFREKELLEVFRTFHFERTGRFAEFFLPMVFHRIVKCLPLSKFLEGLCRLLGLTALWGSPVILKLERVKVTPLSPP
ncbi:MAG: class I SAM-dependent methyltransferase [Chlamydiae bacterium]|nr:class I SAM-dependent methyltransferase [Chlamydiota bacterium]MBI3266858.1 class I SAM-dependent methyltransferase [Chlamydiota bacterium]